MKPNHKSSRREPAAFVHYHNQYGSWLTLLSPFLKHVNMRMLALLMFVGFAVLNTTRGNDAGTKEPAFAGNTETQVIDSRQHADAQPPGGPTNCTTSASSILWELASKLVKSFEMALNDPALIQYAKEQGVETSDSLTTLRSNASSQSATPSEPPLTQSTKPSTH